MQTQDVDAEQVYGGIHALPGALPLKKARVAIAQFKGGFPRSRRSQAATPDRERSVRQVEVVARTGDEALLCERFAMVGRGRSASSPRSFVVYWGARQVAGRWRLFAEAGSHPSHQGQPPKDSRCVAWLAERFGVAEPMSALGQTRCGPMP